MKRNSCLPTYLIALFSFVFRTSLFVHSLSHIVRCSLPNLPMSSLTTANRTLSLLSRTIPLRAVPLALVSHPAFFA